MGHRAWTVSVICPRSYTANSVKPNGQFFIRTVWVSLNLTSKKGNHRWGLPMTDQIWSTDNRTTVLSSRGVGSVQQLYIEYHWATVDRVDYSAFFFTKEGNTEAKVVGILVNNHVCICQD